jgi:antitoxin VapB
MGLNLKNEEAHRLAQDLAGLTGENMTTAVTIAVRERLERVRREREIDERMAKSMAITRDIAKRLGKRLRDLDADALLYDERGLPK